MSITVHHVTDCARCGEDHHELAARPLTRPHAPPEASPLAWNYWATCPTNGEPILMIVTGEREVAS